jgi:hypothetical protein
MQWLLYCRVHTMMYAMFKSDSNHQLDCIVAPQMFHLLENNAIDQYSIVSIQHALVSEVCGCTKVVIVDILPVSKQSAIIGTPLLGDCYHKSTIAFFSIFCLYFC